MARPTKLTDELLTKLDQIADDQWSIKEACETLGIGETTWRRWEAGQGDEEATAEFRRLAARVRAGAGEKVDELAWGALREVMQDPDARPSDRVAAAAAVLRLRTAHKVELTGKAGGPVSLASLARLAADDEG